MDENNKGEQPTREFDDYLGDYLVSGDEPESEPIMNIPDETRIDISQAFSGTISHKLRILSEAIEEIDDLIQIRKGLSKLIQERIEKEIFNSEFLLMQVKPWQLGHNHSIEIRRLGLEREILSLHKEKRSEDVRAWEHITGLIKLKRQFIIEHQNLSGTLHALKSTGP